MGREMTNKEAISNLNHIYGIVSSDIQRSLDLAIKALEERPQGEWILQYRTCGDEFYTCPLCERAIEVDYPQTLKDFPFCHCGADMRGNNNETNN